MALIKSVRGFTPKVGKDCFLADNAVLCLLYTSDAADEL